MILSFDLDGVLADTDNAMLALMHTAVRAKVPGADDDLQQYYARRRLLLNPLDLVGPDDRFIILTGRIPFAHKVTIEWVNHFLPSCDNLQLLGDAETEALYIRGEDSKASLLMAGRKLSVINDSGSAIHFDNNPTIIRQLRAAGVPAVLVGGGLR